MPNFSDITSSLVGTATESVASAAINYSVSIVIGPLVGPVGAAIAPKMIAVAGQQVLTSATAALITKGILACGKVVVNQAVNPNVSTEKVCNEEWDDADVPLVTAKHSK